MSGSHNHKFTAQQLLFFNRYMELLGSKGAAYQAAVDAKYSPKTASQSASRLLNSVKGKEEVDRRLEEMGMPKAEVTARISQLARADVADFFKEETVIHYPRHLVPLQVIIDELQREIEFEDDYAHAIGLSERKAKKPRKGEEQEEDPYDRHFREQMVRKDRILRYKLQLKRNPDAKDIWVGDPVEVRIQKLDLTQARDRGVLHLLKSSKPTKYGESLELYPVDGALRDVAKMRGLFVSKVELDDKRTPRQFTDAQLADIVAKGE